MKKNFYLTMTLLLTLAVGTSYADDDPSVDWTNVAGMREIDKMSDLLLLDDNTPVKLSFSLAKFVWEDENCLFLNDNTGGVVIPHEDENSYRGTKVSGFIYGYYFNNGGIPSLSSVSCNYDNIVDSTPEELEPKGIAEGDFGNNLMNYVKMTATTEIYVWDRDSKLAAPKTGTIFEYIPRFESYITGIPVPTSDGRKTILVTDETSVTVMLPDDIEKSLSERELGLWGIVNRHFDANKWYTMCLPVFHVYYYKDLTAAKFVTSTEGNIEFSTTFERTPGYPYLVKFTKDFDQIDGTITVIEPNNTFSGDYGFVGTLQTTSPNAGCLYLAAENTIKPLAAGGKINAFRAYFEPNTPAASRTRSISIDGTVIATGNGTTDIEDILNGRTNDEGEVYNLNGQRVTGNSYSKGIYIINGKKVIK